jgi:hypothetical protein
VEKEIKKKKGADKCTTPEQEPGSRRGQGGGVRAGTCSWSRHLHAANPNSERMRHYRKPARPVVHGDTVQALLLLPPRARPSASSSAKRDWAALFSCARMHPASCCLRPSWAPTNDGLPNDE